VTGERKPGANGFIENPPVQLVEKSENSWTDLCLFINPFPMIVEKRFFGGLKHYEFSRWDNNIALMLTIRHFGKK